MDIVELNRRIQAEIPAVGALRLEVVYADSSRVAVRIPADGNGNDKGTLFAGSLYSGLVLAGWCLAMERVRKPMGGDCQLAGHLREAAAC